MSRGPIELSHLPADLVPVSRQARAACSMAEKIRAAEAQSIREALERNNGNRLAAARELGLHKSTFFRKVRQLGIGLPEKDGRARSGTGRR